MDFRKMSVVKSTSESAEYIYCFLCINSNQLLLLISQRRFLSNAFQTGFAERCALFMVSNMCGYNVQSFKHTQKKRRRRKKNTQQRLKFAQQKTAFSVV